MQFRTIDQMSGKWRLWHHESVKHLAECVKCDKLFTSYTHATVHLYQTHDVRCIRCGKYCEGLCLMDTIRNLENTYSNEKEEMLQRIERRISEEEERYLNSFEDVSEEHMNQLRYTTHALDEGYTGCMANSWGMLSYLPFMEVSPKFGRLSRFGRKLVKRHQYLSALIKLNLYLNDIQQISRGSLSTVITRYVGDCKQLNNENETVEMPPEMLIDMKLCFPERLIGGPDPKQWTDSMYIERYGVPDRSPTEDEPLPVRGNFSNQQEAPAQEAITKVNEPNTRLKVQSKGNEIQKANITYEEKFSYPSDCNAEEEHPRVMKNLNDAKSFQQ